MKIIFFIILVSVSLLLRGQDTLKRINDFGTGAVTAGVYTHPMSYPFKDDENIIPRQLHMQTIRYYVDKQVIFRDRGADKAGSNSVDSTSGIRVGLMGFSYLIKHDSSILYYYVYKKNKIEKIIRYPLDSCTFEYFYRNTPQNMLSIVRRKETESVLINDIPCFKGEAVEVKTGKPVTFYYHKRKEKIRSPLNVFFNRDFACNVIRVKFITAWSDQGTVNPEGGAMIFQVENYNDRIVDRKLLTLPAGVPVFDNIPLSEVIMESENN